MIRTPLLGKFILASLFVIALMPSMASAQPDKYVAGTHYIVLDTPVRTRDSSKVEVVELFWYGCSHCFQFESLLTPWKKGLSADVDFWQSPAMWNNAMETHAKMFFTAKTLGVLEKLHAPIFTMMNVERKRLVNPEEIKALFADYGVDGAAFDKAFESFSVNSQAKQAKARAHSYKITGTPEMVVNGKYRVTASLAGGQAQMLTVADYLIAKERQALAAK